MIRIVTIVLLFGALITAWAEPIITTQPQNQTNILGSNAVFSVVATGTGALTYQWRSIVASTGVFTNIAGATESTLTLTNVQPTARRLSVRVADSTGSTVSSLATLTVLIPHSITLQPTNQTASLFADAIFRVTGTGVPSPSFQWFFNDQPLDRPSTNRLVITNVQKTNAGAYTVVVSDSLGSVTSRVANLTIIPFDTIYFFGDSWTDTGGNGCTWPLPNYYGNRACNGLMWPEYLSASLGLNYAKTFNFALCGATSLEIQAQATSQYRAPTKPGLSLYALADPGTDFLLWFPGGFRGGYVDPTNAIASQRIIETAVQNVSNTVQRLYEKGARAFLLINTQGTNDHDVILFGPFRAGLYDSYVRSFNARLTSAMEAFSRGRPDVRTYTVDLYALWHDISTHPETYGFTEIVTPALNDPRLTDKSFAGPGANYLLWDGHPTTKFYGTWRHGIWVP